MRRANSRQQNCPTTLRLVSWVTTLGARSLPKRCWELQGCGPQQGVRPQNAARLRAIEDGDKEAGIVFADPDLTKIFGTQPAPAKPTFGREIRNRLIHDFGPSNVDHAKAAAKVLTPVMMNFLACESRAGIYRQTQHPSSSCTERVGQWPTCSITSVCRAKGSVAGQPK